MRLSRLAVALEILPLSEPTPVVGEQATPDLDDCLPGLNDFRSCEQYPVSLLEHARDAKEMILALPIAAPYCQRGSTLPPPLSQPNGAAVPAHRSVLSPGLLGTWSRPGKMVHSLRILGCEHLRFRPTSLDV